MGRSEKDGPQPQEPQDSQQVPRSSPPAQQRPGEDALAVDALPDETRLHGDGDETEMDQSTSGGPRPDESTTNEPKDAPTDE